MATFRLEIVTAERMIFSDDVSAVIAWGVEGQLGILPHHAPLMTMLQPGDLMIRKDKEEEFFAISGGFLEVRPDKVIVLADACERADEIDIARAESAANHTDQPNHNFSHLTLTSLLLRALNRQKVARRESSF
jgi:F-type H+-transporting ATPase subunit epsilon